MNKNKIEKIEKILGVKFNDKKILQQAFVHKSVSKEILVNNERLENIILFSLCFLICFLIHLKITFFKIFFWIFYKK